MRTRARVPAAARRLTLGLLTAFGAQLTPGTVQAQTMDQMNYLFIMIDGLEHARGLGERPVLLDAEGWYGGDFNRFWFKVAGDVSTRESGGEFEAQALFSRLISPWWDLQMGVRMDRAWGGGSQTRPHLVFGIQGLAPYWFEVESTAFVDVDGNVSAQISAAYDVLLSQSLILEPEVEVGLALQDVPEWGIGSGMHELDLGARLRWEIKREFAPYLGYVWSRSFGETADLRRLSGAAYREGSLVFGIRAWY
ncbi:MAG: copper resistance protein B [Gemmatimonadota bacterium]